MAYTVELKNKVIQFLSKGKSFSEAVEAFGVSKGAICAWNNEYKTLGIIAPAKVQDRSHLRKITPEKIEAFLSKNPTANQLDMAKEFGCKDPSVSIALRKFGYTKKNSARYTKNQTNS